MEENAEIWREFYEKALSKPHSQRTELAVRLNESSTQVAVDCGCGTGSDIDYLEQKGYQVHGFDINPDSVAICRDRFGSKTLVEISHSSFEYYDYPNAGIVLANSSLFFADPSKFQKTWVSIESCIEIGGVFAGDFMGVEDSWASNYRSHTAPLTESQVRSLFEKFEVIRFAERNEHAKTSLGKMKHWHIFSVVAVKRVQ
ncbi:class I SAM-dependent methyltransferase [Nitrincola sp. MINF-07-Sa-05]|uniref:class I SAM-dependent methyltransferase n=1 Tax=Nitrincola salilacus TaxID=3400273 RepID=UPI003917FA8B